MAPSNHSPSNRLRTGRPTSAAASGGVDGAGSATRRLAGVLGFGLEAVGLVGVAGGLTGGLVGLTRAFPLRTRSLPLLLLLFEAPSCLSSASMVRA